jgi:hypothetical protein
MALKKQRTGIIVIATISLTLCLSSCTGPVKTGADENRQGTAYLENMGNGICRQHPSGLMWQAGRSPNFSNWEDAHQYVEALDLGGFDDWRLPDPEECLSLSRLIQMKTGDCQMETGGNHWVSKTNNIEAGQWESNVLCDGPIFRWTKDKKGTVKAVRP